MSVESRLEWVEAKIQELEEMQAEGDDTRFTRLQLQSFYVLRSEWSNDC